MSGFLLAFAGLLLANTVILVWLVVKRGSPLKPAPMPSEMLAGPEAELAELIAKGRALSVELQRISECVTATESSAQDVQSRFLRYLMSQSEIARKHQAAGDAMANSLMELIDHADAALESACPPQPTTSQQQSETSVTLEQLRAMALDSLRRSGFRQMEIEAGQPFNSRRQRAIDRKPGPRPADAILQVVRRGYLGSSRDGEYVVRSALVVVSDGPVQENPSVSIIESAVGGQEPAKEETK